MIKRIVFFAFLFALTVLVVYNCRVSVEECGIADYFNVVFCNFKTYPDYLLPAWSLTNILFYLFFVCGGIYFSSERIRDMSGGFHAMMIARYGSCRRYLLRCQAGNALRAVVYSALSLALILLAVLLVDPQAFLKVSTVTETELFSFLAYAAVWFVKITVICALFESWLVYRIIRIRFDVMILAVIVIVGLMLFLDTILKAGILTFCTEASQAAVIICYLLVYGVSFFWIDARYRRKELW